MGAWSMLGFEDTKTVSNKLDLQCKYNAKVDP